MGEEPRVAGPLGQLLSLIVRLDSLNLYVWTSIFTEHLHFYQLILYIGLYCTRISYLL
jgi:hypothetical protein